jgi:hypothetical protein
MVVSPLALRCGVGEAGGNEQQDEPILFNLGIACVHIDELVARS